MPSDTENIANQADSAQRTDEFRMDAGALYNALTGVGIPEYDKSMHTQVGMGRRLNKIQLEELYASSWLLQRACTAHIGAALRRGYELKLGGDDSAQSVISDFNDYTKRLHLKKTLTRMGTWSAIYGGCGGVMVIEDGRPAWEPLDEDNIQSIRTIEPLDTNHLRPDLTLDFNPLDPVRYELVLSRHYARKLGDLQKDGNRYVHNSRILRFDGIEVPPDMMLRNPFNTYGWGQSLINLIFDAFQRYDTVNAGIANMVASFDVFVFTMNNLKQLSTQKGGEAELKRRFELIMMGLSTFRGLVVDSNERAEFLTRNYSGLSDIAEGFRNELIGATKIPHTILFGESPSGLGATGESEMFTWAETISQYQEEHIRPIHERLFTLIFKAKDGPTGGVLPDDWSYDYKSLVVESEMDIIAKRSQQASVDQTYVGLEVLLPQEVRQSRFGGSQYSHETVLDQEQYQAAVDRAMAQAEGGQPGQEGMGEEGYEDLGFEDFGGFGDFSNLEEFASPEELEQLPDAQLEEQAALPAVEEEQKQDSALTLYQPFLRPDSVYGRRWAQLNKR